MLNGTNDAFSLVSQLKFENSLVILGDIFFKIDLLKLIDFHDTKVSDLTLVTHPNTHPNDSDLVETNINSQIVKFHSKNRTEVSQIGNNAIAGIFLVRNKIISLRSPLIKDIVESFVELCLEKQFSIFAFNTISIVTDL
jgi:NDP-sugar pyrophosphorylase family protein